MSRTPFALAVLSALAVACGGGSSRLEGKWKGLRADGVPPEAQTRANDFALQTEIEVKGDTITVKSPSDRQTGKYKVIEDSKTKVVIVTDKDGPEDKQTFTFADEKTMKWTVIDGKTITFVKQ